MRLLRWGIALPACFAVCGCNLLLGLGNFHLEETGSGGSTGMGGGGAGGSGGGGVGGGGGAGVHCTVTKDVFQVFSGPLAIPLNHGLVAVSGDTQFHVAAAATNELLACSVDVNGTVSMPVTTPLNDTPSLYGGYVSAPNRAVAFFGIDANTAGQFTGPEAMGAISAPPMFTPYPPITATAPCPTMEAVYVDGGHFVASCNTGGNYILYGGPVASQAIEFNQSGTSPDDYVVHSFSYNNDYFINTQTDQPTTPAPAYWHGPASALVGPTPISLAPSDHYATVIGDISTGNGPLFFALTLPNGWSSNPMAAASYPVTLWGGQVTNEAGFGAKPADQLAVLGTFANAAEFSQTGRAASSGSFAVIPGFDVFATQRSIRLTYVQSDGKSAPVFNQQIKMLPTNSLVVSIAAAVSSNGSILLVWHQRNTTTGLDAVFGLLAACSGG